MSKKNWDLCSGVILGVLGVFRHPVYILVEKVEKDVPDQVDGAAVKCQDISLVLTDINISGGHLTSPPVPGDCSDQDGPGVISD